MPPEKTPIKGESSSSERSHRGSHRHSRRHRPRKTRVDHLENAGGILLCILAAATPWLFGTTEDWSVLLMNVGTVAAGLFFLPSLFARSREQGSIENKSEKGLRMAFLSVNLLLLLFCVLAYFNARSTFSVADRAFTYYDHVVGWLPTTYDRHRTGQFLFNALAFFIAFWGLRRWLEGGWHGSNGHSSGEESSLETGARNSRLKLVLWILAMNGFALALQGIFQRLTGSSKLLWSRPSWWATYYSCFGPFSYRGNAADYLNLIWPVTFGLWYYIARRKLRPGRLISDGPELLLLPMFLLTAAATFITLSRGASVTAAAMLLVLLVILLSQTRSKIVKISMVGATVAIFGLVLAISEGQLLARFRHAASDQLSGREEIYANAKQIAADFPWFGSGPGSFLSIYHLYRESAGQVWQAFLHDDWLETRVTFGWIGFALVILQFALLFAWAWSARQAWISRVLSLCLFLSLAGCLLHAKVDFPFQTYSIEFTFVILAAILVSSRYRKASPALPTEEPGQSQV